MREFKTDKKYIFEFNSVDKSIFKPFKKPYIAAEYSNESEVHKKHNLNNDYDEITHKEYKEPEKNIESRTKVKSNIKRNLVILAVAIFVIGMILSNIDQSSNYGSPEKISTTEEEMNYKETATLKELMVTSKEEGDAIFFEDSVIDAYGNAMNDVVHPGSTGTVKSTGGGGAHPAQGFNRVYTNEGYANFSGTLFISEGYATYTKHVLTLVFEVYGDGQLLYEAPRWQTGNSYNMLPFDIDISSYNEIRIHFEAVNDSNLFSWEECTFGISEPTFSKLPLGQQNTAN